MRTRTEMLLLAVLLAVPVGLAVVGWPAFLNWVAGPPPQPTPQVAGAAATSVAAAQTSLPTPRPTVGAPPTLAGRAVTGGTSSLATSTPVATVSVASTPVTAASRPATAVPAANGRATVDDPSAAVAQFYSLVAQHQFGSAAELWSPHMRAAFPPQQNINERFGETQSLALRRADVVSQDPSAGRAAVAVDVVESSQGTSRHWVGTWFLVRGSGGWLLDEPDLTSQ